MNIIKFIIYCGIFLLLFSNILSEDTQKLLFYAYLSFIYYDSKDQNIQSLVVILAIVEFIFFELDYFIFIVSKYYFDTGLVAGNIILDILILINMLCLIASIFYRCELMEWFSRVFNLKLLEYLPTKADIVQIYVIRMILFVHIVCVLIHASMVYKLNHADYVTYDRLYTEIKSYGNLYVLLAEKLDLLRYFAIVLVLSPWSKQINKNSPYYTLKM